MLYAVKICTLAPSKFYIKASVPLLCSRISSPILRLNIEPAVATPPYNIFPTYLSWARLACLTATMLLSSGFVLFASLSPAILAAPLSIPGHSRSAPERRSPAARPGFGEGFLAPWIAGAAPGVAGGLIQAGVDTTQHEINQHQAQQHEGEVNPALYPPPPDCPADSAAHRRRSLPVVKRRSLVAAPRRVLDAVPTNASAPSDLSSIATHLTEQLRSIVRDAIDAAKSEQAFVAASFALIAKEEGTTPGPIEPPNPDISAPAAVDALRSALLEAAAPAIDHSRESLDEAMHSSAAVIALRSAFQQVKAAAMHDAAAVRAAAETAVQSIVPALEAAVARLSAPELAPRRAGRPCLPGDKMCPYRLQGDSLDSPAYLHAPESPAPAAPSTKTEGLEPRGDGKPCLPGNTMCPYVPPDVSLESPWYLHGPESPAPAAPSDKTGTVEPRGEIRACVPGDAMCPYRPPHRPHHHHNEAPAAHHNGTQS